MPMSCSRASAAPPPATGTSRGGRAKGDARIWSRPSWLSPRRWKGISSTSGIGLKPRGWHAGIHDIDGVGRAAGSDERGYRPDHSQAIFEDDQADGLAGRTVL